MPLLCWLEKRTLRPKRNLEINGVSSKRYPPQQETKAELAMKSEEWREQRARFLVHLYVRWGIKGYGRIIQDEATHQRFVEAMREKYVFPNYLDLVGPVRPEHHDKSFKPDGRARSWQAEQGCLTNIRRAELLLLGAHSWQGMWIGTHEAFLGYRPEENPYWFEPRWTSESRGWYVALDYRPPRRKRLTLEEFVTPFRSSQVMRLEHYLVSQSRQLSATEAIRFRNGNAFDCRPENLEVYSLVGRPMRCKGCGQRIGRDRSVRIKLDGTTQRYCYEYLAWAEEMGCTPEISKCMHRM